MVDSDLCRNASRVPSFWGIAVAQTTDDMTDERLIDLLRYWERLCGSRSMPVRRELDPVLLPRRILPHLFIADVQDGDYVCRLAGTALETEFGRGLAGLSLRDLPLGGKADVIYDQYDEAAVSKRPTYCENSFTDARSLIVNYQRLLLPLSPNDHDVTELLGACIFQRR